LITKAKKGGEGSPKKGQLDLFVALPGDLPTHDQQEMMERPFVSLSKGKRLEPIDYRPERWLDRSILWNEVEAIERREDAVLAREVELALPRELSQAESIALAQDFVRQQFVSHGMVADLNVHWTRKPLRLTLGEREQPNRMAAR
jgi:hypothetical protein